MDSETFPRPTRAASASNALRQTWADKAQQIVERTSVFDDTAEAAIPKFKASEIVLGRVVGRGGFCVVLDVTGIKIKGKKSFSRRRGKLPGEGRKLKSTAEDHITDGMSDAPSSTVFGTDALSRDYLASKTLRKGKPRYVIKTLPDNVNSRTPAYAKGRVDLLLEAKFLAALVHPNIIRLRGLSDADPFMGDGFFLILEKFHMTFLNKMKLWSNKDRASRGVTGLLTGGKARSKELTLERLQVAYDIASAMGYLHGRRLIYRDLKPDNLGFNVYGKVTLIDFGLTKQIVRAERIRGEHPSVYRMTACTGAIRYMAPEVGLSRPYNQKADVYSFGMVLWFIFSCEPPFANYTPEMLPKRVFQRGYRPVLLDEWTDDLKDLIDKCWDSNYRNRPSFRRIKQNVHAQIRSVAPGAALLMEQSHGGSAVMSSESTGTSASTSSSSKHKKQRKARKSKTRKHRATA